METKRLRQFCVIAELGSLTEASELLHITHSGLSKAMKLLEDELQVELFQPQGRGIELTSHGQDMYERAKEFLALEQQLFAKEATSKVEHWRIGFMDLFIVLLSANLKSLGAPCQLLHYEPCELEAAVYHNEIDLGVTFVPFSSKRVSFVPIKHFSSSCYTLKGYFKNEPIESIPFITPATPLEDNPLGINSRDGWSDSLSPRISPYQTCRFQTALLLTIQGHGAIHMPDFIAKEINVSLKKPLVRHKDSSRFSQKRDVFLVLPKSQKKLETIKPVKRWLEGLLKKL